MARRRFITDGLGFVGLAYVTLVGGCDSGVPGAAVPGAPESQPTGALLEGRLVIETGPGVRTAIEREPNDWSDGSQFLGQPSDGQEYRIVGVISSPPPDNDVDTYRFTTTTPLTVTWRIRSADPQATSQFEADVGVIDFLTFTCDLDGLRSDVFADCVTDALSGGAGAFAADGTFEIVVVPSRGKGSYVLEVAFGPPGDVPAASTRHSAPAGKRKSLVPVRRTYEPPRGDVVIGEALATFDPDVTPAEIETVVRARGLRVIERAPCGVYRLGDAIPEAGSEVQARMRTHKTAADLAALPGVRMAEPNRVFRASVTPNDQFYSVLRYPEVINLPRAWDVSTGDREVVVALIDTGVLYEHPDLGGRLLGGYDFVSDVSEARDGDGRDDDPSDPGDALDATQGSSFHGTHTAGTVAAMANNRLGTVGVTWSCRVLPVRALGRASAGDAFDIAEAIRYAAGLDNASGTRPPRRADVINLSLDGGAGQPSSTVVQSAVRDAAGAGAVLVAAAGNQGASDPAFPAGYEEVISVAAVDWELNIAAYSNRGPTIELVAPGGDDVPGPDGEPCGLLSTVGSDISGPITFEYGYRFGTSMACPQVSGAAALMVSANPYLSADQVRRILVETAVDLGEPGRDELFGYGLLDVASAVERARSTVGQSEPAPRLSLSATTLDFGDAETALTISVTNAGGGLLVVEDVSAREWVGAGWLSATSSGATASSTVTTIGATVDRSRLRAGVYRGAVEVRVAGVVTAVDVYARVAGSTGPPDVVHVVAVDPITGQVVDHTEADAGEGFSFTLEGAFDEPVLLLAGTDRDGDGTICEAGDACGAWPSLLGPLEVDLNDGDDARRIEVSVFEPPSGADWPVAPITAGVDD
ncbi:MAG: S8 family serine peptidase [Phycisphaerales bacterium]|nr:MAG: S8 family serine peptidase [Phycisphaerales bacterium]